MVEIYSPHGEEGQVSEFLLEKAKELNLEPWTDDVGNVYGKVGKGRPTILLCGHMDTVPGKLPMKLEDGFLYGRGTVDAKSCLAGMLMAASAFRKEKIPGSILFLAVVDEEGMGKGIRRFMEEDIPIDYGIFGEPSGVEAVTIGYKGSVHLKVTTLTETGHSAASWLFENAIEKAYDLWGEIKKHHESQSHQDSKFYSVTSCLTQVTGGGSSTVVPSSCEMHVDVRIPPKISSKQLVEEISKIARSFEDRNPKVKVQVSVEDFSEPYEVEAKSDLVRSFIWAIRRVRFTKVRLLRKTGSSDMNLLQTKMDIPMVAYGPGDSHLDHTTSEKVSLGDYLDSIEVYKEAIRRLFQTTREA